MLAKCKFAAHRVVSGQVCGLVGRPVRKVQPAPAGQKQVLACRERPRGDRAAAALGGVLQCVRGGCTQCHWHARSVEGQPAGGARVPGSPAAEHSATRWGLTFDVAVAHAAAVRLRQGLEQLVHHPALWSRGKREGGAGSLRLSTADAPQRPRRWALCSERRERTRTLAHNTCTYE